MTTTIQIQDSIIQIPSSSQQYPSVILFGLPKTGTTLLNKVFQKACFYLDMGYFPLHGELFKQGLGSARDGVLAPLSDVFSLQGYAYGTFRKYYKFITSSTLKQTNKIVIVRDPKDMLVSDYFSMAYSHPAPGGNAQKRFQRLRNSLLEIGINQAVQERLPNFAKRMQVLRKALPEDKLKVYRYEDIIFKKKSWIQDMMEFCEWPLTDQQISTIVEAVDIFPEKEDKSNHIRQVSPGNYKQHLNEETIAYIDEYLDLFLFRECMIKREGWRSLFGKYENLKGFESNP